jgi:hypothetical protein
MTDIIDQCARAAYEDKPFTVHSNALSDASGLNVGEPIPYDTFLKLGGNDDGVRRHIRVTLTCIKELAVEPTPEMIELGCLAISNAVPEDGRVEWPGDFSDESLALCRSAVQEALRVSLAKLFEEVGP